MKKFFLLALLPFLTLSCSKDHGTAGEDGKGTLVISAMAEDGVNEVNLMSRASAVGYLYTIQGPGGYTATGTVGTESIQKTVATGNYTVNVFSEDNYESKLPAFDLAVYGATEMKPVTANSTATFNMTCTQINTGIKFIFDQSVIDYFGDDLVATVTNVANPGKTKSYTQQDVTKTVYFMPGNALLTLKDGETVVPIGGESSRTLELEARELWTITLKTSLSSNGEMVIVIDVDTDVDEQNPEFGIGEITGTGEEATPYSIQDAINVMPAQGVWVEGVITGTTEITTRSAYASNNILLGMEEGAAAKNSVVIELEEGSALHSKLNLQDHPAYVGKTIKLKCDIIADDGFDSEAFAVLNNVEVGTVNITGLTLKDAAPFKIGVALATDHLTESGYAAAVLKDFNSVSPENALKWNRIAREGNEDPESWDWSEAEDYVNFAVANNLRIHGHAILWYSYLPNWVKDLARSGSAYTKEQWIALMQKIVKAVVGRYKGKIASWDIVNEAWGDTDLYIGSVDHATDYNVWADKIGPEYIKLAYQAAREADPDCLLFYNDNILMYGDESPHTGRTTMVYNFIKNEVNNGVKLIDGIGIQLHGHRWYPADGLMDYSMQKAAETGLLVHLSEVSIKLNNGEYDYAEYTEVAAGEQSGRYEQLFKRYIQHVPAAQRYGVTIWGVTDKYSFQVIEGGVDWPLLFDNDYKPKPPYYAILDVLSGVTE